MPVTEIAILRLLHDHDKDDNGSLTQNLLQSLKTAKDAMESYSGHHNAFHYLRDINDPGRIYIIGAWPSVEFHMTRWIPSAENQKLLESLEGQVAVDEMFHVGIDQTTSSPIPMIITHANVIVIERNFLTTENGAGAGQKKKADFETSYYAKVQPFLERQQLAGNNDDDRQAVAVAVAGGWRLDVEQQPQGSKDEFISITGWDSMDEYDQFAQTEAFHEYAEMRERLGIIESSVNFAKLLDVVK